MSTECVVCRRPPGPDEPASSPDGVPLSWSRQVGRGGHDDVVCPDCTRAALRGIEARLDPEWW